jgi:hypothetical protein
MWTYYRFFIIGVQGSVQPLACEPTSLIETETLSIQNHQSTVELLGNPEPLNPKPVNGYFYSAQNSSAFPRLP